MALPARLRLLAILALLAACTAMPAAAQGWFGNLFGGGSPLPRPGAPAYPGYGGSGGYRGGGGGYGGGYAPSDDYYRPRRHAQKRKAAPPTEDVAKEAPKPPAKNATFFVDVFGDSLGQMLADGLDDALADRSDVAVVHRAKGSSGLVASDFYDWPKAIDDLLAGREGGKDAAKDAAKDAGGAKAAVDEQAAVTGGSGATTTTETGKADRKPGSTARESVKDAKTAARPPRIDVAVMMIGSNDRQPIREGGQSLAFGTPEWTAAYAKRVNAIDETFRAHNIPLIWVGLPIAKDDGFADAMAGLNDITRDAAAKTGAVYVDTWEAFSDDNGDFASYGPDINGQTVRLRSTDGVHFTRAGDRKLAHFVVTHVLRALDGKTPAPQLPTAEATEDAAKPVAAAKPDAGPIRNLNEAPDSRSGALASLPTPAQASGSDPLVATVITRGEAVPIPAGRADDARWPAQGAPEP